MITVEDLRKEYDGFVAVDGSTFSVGRGEVFGVVGPNGAGKTTTLKTLAGLIEPTSGTVSVAGLAADDPEMRRNLGFLPEESPLYEEMTAHSYLEFFADLYDVPDDVADERITEALDRLDLEHRERRIGDMSKGMKRKVAIARSLVNDPDVLIYDEPASGLDPLTTNYIIEFTEQLAAQGKTIVFSAHNLYHVESICDRVIVMNHGEIIARGTLEEIRREHGSTEYHVYTDVELDASEPAGDDRHESVVGDMDAVEALRSQAAALGGSVVDIQTRDPSLEDIFLDIAGETPEQASEGERDRTVEAET
ncbi:ABC transporter ATP-binding protein [Haloarchaeobius litoreus]|uniref:ATP-binding cassette domain-containing protein n=1 Tax=Haloarchaeobius litoreus TaxID=755306 RepID=A0ABD6DHL8_9EURY|nr:ABC transporter ATP-binding protein [Haloarchaeobius litoreus]